MDELNASQHLAIRTPGHLFCSAGPGCGKTRVLTERLAFLAQTNPTARLAAVTFTAESAGELVERIRDLLGPAAAERVQVGTFHALARSQLVAAGLKPRFLDEHEIGDLIRRVWEAGDTRAPIEQVQMEIERRKATLEALPGDAERDPGFAAYVAYQAALRELGALDYQDQILETVRGMRTGRVQSLAVQFLLVDECQDIDEAQYAYIQAHVAAGAAVTLVGDDDQSLYGFRFALGYAGITRFQRDNGAAHVPLEVSYRCPQRILEHAGRLIAHNADRVPKRIHAANPLPGDIQVVAAGDRDDEAQRVVDAIVASRAPGRWAVLARTNRLLDSVERALTEAEIPRVRVGAGFWEAPGSQLFCATLGALLKNDYRPVERLLRAARVSETTLEDARRRVGALTNGSLARFLGATLPSTLPNASVVGGLQARAREWRALLAGGRLNLALHGVAGWIDPHVAPRVRRLDTTTCADSMTRMRGTLAQRLALTRRRRERSETSVTLMTLHAAKGLQWPHVWVIGLQDGQLPHHESTLEEERRLCYVGMTRAQETLALSYPTRAKRGRLFPSQFLDEAGLRRA